MRRALAGASVVALILAMAVLWWLPDLPKLLASYWALRGGATPQGQPGPGSVTPAFYDGLVVLQRLAMPHSKLSTCMNYGWAGSRAPKELAAMLDNDERFCLQLYDAVARAGVFGSFDGATQDSVGSAQGGLLQGRDVVEVGCGRGGGAAFLYAHHQPRSFRGIDASTEQIREAHRRLEGRVGTLQFHVGSADTLPITNTSADMVINVESMHTYRHPKRFLREVFRVLRPGGIFVLADAVYTSRRMQPAFIAESGFTKVLHIRINDGVARAISASTFYSNLLSKIPPWVYALLGPHFKSMMEKFSALPNGTVHRAFAQGHLAYELGVYHRH